MAVKFAGQSRDISTEEVRIAQIVLKYLYKNHSVQTVGKVAGIVKLPCEHHVFVSTIEKLTKFEMIRTIVMGGTPRIQILQEGWEYSSELLGAEEGGYKTRLADQADWFLDPQGNRTPTSKEFASIADELGLAKPVKRSDFD